MKPKMLLVSVIVAGLLIRLWGLSFGLPYRYHIDETQIVAPAARLCAGDYQMPPNFAGPNLQHMILCAGDMALYGVGLVTGRWHTPSEFALTYEADPTAVILLARLIHVLLATGTIAVVYGIGRVLWNELVGLAAAAILAFTYFHVRESHFASRDLFTSAFLASSLLFAARLLKSRSPKDAMLSGLFAGMAAGVMWTAGVGVLSGIAAYWLSFRTSAGGPGLISNASRKTALAVLLAAAVGFLFAYPNLILRPAVALDYARILVGYAGQGELGNFAYDSSPGWLFYLKTLWWGAGPAALGVFLGGILLALSQRTSKDWVLLAFAAPYFAVIAGTANYIGRYITPLIPVLAVLGARFLVWCAEWIGRRSLSPRRVLAAATVLVMFPSFLSSLKFDYVLNQVDTRTLAKDWIEEHIPENSKIALDWPIHGPPVSSAQVPQPSSQKIYQVVIVDNLGLAQLDLADYCRQGVDLMVTSSNISNLRLRDRSQEARRQEFYRSLGEKLPLLAEFTPHSGNMEPPFVFDEIYGPAISVWQRERPGPTLRIYALRGYCERAAVSP